MQTIEEPEVKVTPKKEDVINHPSHTHAVISRVIDFIEDQQPPYHLGNVIRYIARAGYKGDKLEDLKSAVVFRPVYQRGNALMSDYKEKATAYLQDIKMIAIMHSIATA